MKHYLFIAIACIFTGLGLFGLAGAIYVNTNTEIYVPLLSGSIIFMVLGVVIVSMLGLYAIAKIIFAKKETK